MNTEQKLQKIIDHFGIENQKKKLCDEWEEFIDAVRNKLKEHQTEELADVFVVRAQIELVRYGTIQRSMSDVQYYCEVYDLCFGDTMRIARDKINRTLENIEKDPGYGWC